MALTATMLTALATLTACDRLNDITDRSGRDDRLYKEAMADYSAGRLDAALKGFERALAANPANVDARFQLACLQQDRAKAHLEAVCNYREFLLQAPRSEKALIARERMAVCEKLLAAELAERHGIVGDAALSAAVERGKTACAAAERERDELAEKLKTAEAQVVRLEGELARARKALGSVGADESDRPLVKMDAKSLLDDESEGDRILLSDDLKALRAEEAEEAAAPEDTATPFAVTDAKTSAPAKTKPELPHEARPATYVVQEGDTLFKIANRFYGRTSAWSEIREANKTTISTDCRIKTGQKIVLP